MLKGRIFMYHSFSLTVNSVRVAIASLRWMGRDTYVLSEVM